MSGFVHVHASRLAMSGVCAILLASCATTVPPMPTLVDELNCAVPPPTLFKKMSFSLEVAKAAVGAAALDNTKIQLEPTVVSLLSQAARDKQVLDYLRCRAVKGYPADEAQWYMQLFTFADVTPPPTADAMAQFLRDHPSPSERRAASRAGAPAPPSTMIGAKLDSKLEYVALPFGHGAHAYASMTDGKVSWYVRDWQPEPQKSSTGDKAYIEVTCYASPDAPGVSRGITIGMNDLKHELNWIPADGGPELQQDGAAASVLLDGWRPEDGEFGGARLRVAPSLQADGSISFWYRVEQ